MSDHTRFEELVLPHLDAAHNLARWLARDNNDAEDVVQEACVRALKYARSANGSSRGWFLTIVRHAFYDWRKRNRPVAMTPDDTAIDMAPDPAAVDPEQAVLRSAESKTLARAIAALPRAYREALILREMEDLSYKEIARTANIPVGTVMSRLARARGLLQQSLRAKEETAVPADTAGSGAPRTETATSSKRGQRRRKQRREGAWSPAGPGAMPQKT